ncbi:hypothetical protein SK128_024658, partial [Halocaridina rubra]
MENETDVSCEQKNIDTLTEVKTEEPFTKSEMQVLSKGKKSSVVKCVAEYNINEGRGLETSRLDIIKYFSCKICDRSFANRDSLRSHSFLHIKRVHICDICGRPFSQKGDLRKHLLIHSGEKPFQCDLCLRSFNRKQHLIRHSRIHSGEKPYVCKICGKAFP